MQRSMQGLIPIENPSNQTKELRECLRDCNAAYDLLQVFKEREPNIPLDHDYLTDYDLVDYCIREDFKMHNLYKTCKVFTSYIEFYAQTNLNSSSGPLRPSSNESELLRCIVNTLQRGDFSEAINLIQQSSQNWLVDVLKSLAPMHDQLIKEVDFDQLCLLDFMRLPAFGNGNPHYLLTMQALQNYQAGPQEKRIIDWVMGEKQGIDYHDQGWYVTMLMNFKSLLQQNVLQVFLEKKQIYQDKLYYGYGQDTPLNLKSFYDFYGKIYQNIYNKRNATIQEGIQDLLEQDGIKQQSIKIHGKRVQILLVAQHVDLFQDDPQVQIMEQIQEIIEKLSQTNFQGINKQLGLQLIFEWAHLAAEIDQTLSQQVLKMAIETIIVETRTQAQGSESLSYQDVAFELTLLLLKDVNDDEFIAKQLSEFMITCNNINELKDKIVKNNFSPEVRDLFLDNLLKSSNYDQLRVKDSIQMIQAMEFSRELYDEKMMNLLREVLSQCDESLVVEAFYIVIQHIQENTQEIQSYKAMIETYEILNNQEMYERDGIITQSIEIINDLIQLDERGRAIIETIKLNWIYKILYRIIQCASNDMDRKFIFQCLQALVRNGLLTKIPNLRTILAILPVEDDDNFMKFIIS